MSPRRSFPTSRPDHGRRRAGRGRWILVGLTLALVVAGATFAWRAYRLPVRIEAGLPALPDLVEQPPELARRLREADAAARRGTGPQRLSEVVRLGFLYHANDYAAEARACWQLLRREQPDEARWPYYLGDLARGESDQEEMLAQWEAVVELAPDYAPAWLHLGRARLKQGQLAEAAQCFRRRLELLPEDPFAALEQARMDLQRGEAAAARQQLEALTQRHPAYSPGHNLLAELLAQEGKEAAAARHRRLGSGAGRQAEAADPWLDELVEWCLRPGRLLLWAEVRWQTEVGDRGRSLLERATALVPDQPEPWLHLGAHHLKTGEPVLAREALERARAGFGSRAPVAFYVTLAEAWRASGEPLRALEVAEEGSVAFGPAPELHHARGEALLELGDPVGAAMAFEDALDLAPAHADANFNLALIRLDQGRDAQALRHLHQSLTQQPTFHKSLALLGQRALEAGDLEEAEQYVRPLFEGNPRQPLAQELFAQWALRRSRAAQSEARPAHAEASYREGLEAAPDHPDLIAELGLLLLNQARVAEARPLFERYRSLRPDDAQGALLLGQAYVRLRRLAEARAVLIEGEQLALRRGATALAAHCREIAESLDRRAAPR